MREVHNSMFTGVFNVETYRAAPHPPPHPHPHPLSSSLYRDSGAKCALAPLAEGGGVALVGADAKIRLCQRGRVEATNLIPCGGSAAAQSEA